jgi:hypothetical protein
MKNGMDVFVKSMGIIAFVADCIAIYLFIRDVFNQSVDFPSQRSVSLVIVIILAFLFAISLIRFSGKESDGVFMLFGMVYAVFAAVIFGLGSMYILQGYAPWLNIVLYLVMGIIVSVFASVVMNKSNMDLRWASIPFILTSIIQIAFVVVTFFNGGNIPFPFYLFLVSEIIVISIFLSKT